MSVGLLFLLGLAALLGGARLLVSSSAGLASRFGIPSLFIGITVVAFATSAPEIAVSLDAVFNEKSNLALGNVVGSNIANILLILGISAIISPVAIKRRIVRLDVPIMLAASLTVYVMGLDGNLSPVDGAVLLLLFAAFMVFQIYQARTVYRAAKKSNSLTNGKPGAPVWVQGIVMLAGLGLLALGAHWLVSSSIELARNWGLSELVIGLTIIALGTSLPELATSVLAARSNESDLSVGNVIGSNIFNLLLILGIAALFSGSGIIVSGAALALDLPVMIAVSIACLPIFFTGHLITRWEGGVFLGYYIAYMLYLFLDASQHKLLPLFNYAMVWFVVPISLLTLLVIVVRSIRNGDNI